MFRRSAATLTIVGLAVLASASSAYAYWTVYGSGTSTATVATVKPLVIDPVDIKDMVIGRPASLNGEVRNPNNFEASLTDVRLTVTMKVDQDHRGCTAKDFTLAPPTTTAKLIKANGKATFDGGTITLIDTGTDQAACQGATLTLDYLLK
jgi:hypothetical protein